MKTLILGKKAIGKTRLIKEKLIQTFKNFIVIDVSNEYDKYKYNNVRSYGNLSFDEKKQAIINDLKTGVSNNDNAWILESFSLIDDDFTWLEELIKDKNVIMTFQSIQSLKNQKVPDVFDEIYFFPTMDNDDIRTKYLSEQMGKGTKVHIINNVN